jgi:PAS domain-containing protein
MALYTEPFSDADIEADWDRAIRREQLTILIRQAPFLATVNIVNALLLGVIVAGQVPPLLVWSWTAVIAVGALYPLRVWWRSRLPNFRLSGSERSIRRAVIQACVAGGFWALAAPAFAGFLDERTELFLYIVLAGMVAGGSITLSSLPLAALGYGGAIGTTVLIFVFRHYDDTTFISLGVMLLLYFFVTGYAGRTVFGAATKALKDRAVEAEYRRQVQHQFRDFAAAACDWLWESDASHRLTQVTDIRSDRVPADNGCFSGISLLDLEPLDPDGPAALDTLLRAGARLHNQICILWDGAGERRVVAVNAVPLRHPDGDFRGYRGSFTDMSAFVAALRRAATGKTVLGEAIDKDTH